MNGVCKNIKPENLNSLSENASLIFIRDRVEVMGLTSPAGQKLNGQTGVVLSWENDRYRIKFDDGRDARIKKINLSHVKNPEFKSWQRLGNLEVGDIVRTDGKFDKKLNQDAVILGVDERGVKIFFLDARDIHQKQFYYIQPQHIISQRRIMGFLREPMKWKGQEKLIAKLYKEEIKHIAKLLPPRVSASPDVLEIGSGDGYLSRAIESCENDLADRMRYSEPDAAARLRGQILNPSQQSPVLPLSIQEIIDQGHTEGLNMIISANVLDVMPKLELGETFSKLASKVKKGFKVVHIQQFDSGALPLDHYLSDNKLAFVYLDQDHKRSIAVFDPKHSREVSPLLEKYPQRYLDLQGSCSSDHERLDRDVARGKAKKIDVKNLCQKNLEDVLSEEWELRAEDLCYQLPSDSGKMWELIEEGVHNELPDLDSFNIAMKIDAGVTVPEVELDKSSIFARRIVIERK